MAEFALLLPVFLLILLIVVDFGRLFQSWVQLNNAARIGASYAGEIGGAYQTGDSLYRALVASEMDGAACVLQPSPTTPPDPTFSNNGQLGGLAKVALTCQFHFFTPVVDLFGGSGGLAVSASAQFPITRGVSQ